MTLLHKDLEGRLDELEEVVKPLRIVLPTEIVDAMKRRIARFTNKKIEEARKQGAELQMKAIKEQLKSKEESV